MVSTTVTIADSAAYPKMEFDIADGSNMNVRKEGNALVIAGILP